MKEQMNVEMSASTGIHTLSTEEKTYDQQGTRRGQLNFSDPQKREVHVHVFRERLPEILFDAPGIDWNRLSSNVMGYLLRNAADGPDAIPIIFAIGCAMEAMKQRTLRSYCSHLVNLFRRLRTQYGMNELAQLRSRQIWDRFVAQRMLSSGDVRLLQAYESLASIHVRSYLEGLGVRQRVIWEQYALPPLPVGFIDKQAHRKAVETATQQKRKEQSDILLPLFPLLVEIALLRKQAAERFIKEFRRHRDRAIAGEIELPYHFQFTDRFFSVSQDASSVAETTLIEREVTVSLTLWDRMSWVKEHIERYGSWVRYTWKHKKNAYAPENNTYFLQYEGNPADLLWYGDLIAQRRMGYESAPSGKGGISREFCVSRPGLLTPSLDQCSWFVKHGLPDEMLFEPEALYRGALYAAALATLSLTNGSRLNELLQISTTRFETLVVDELKNQQPTGRKIGILVQHLLPKGARQESERQFFLIGEMPGRLLAEIGQMLELTHGGSIPIIHPRRNTKEEDLHPEPYLFQWAASADGRLGLLEANDVGTLLRFLFHGLTLTTKTGMPIRVATHLLRHVMATHARTVKKVPAEAVAYLLHHRVTLPNISRALSVPEATAYYSRLPVEQLLALLFEAQSRMTSQRMHSYLQVPPPRTLEQMEAALRQIFEQWGTIGPTALGYCGAGLCIRPNNRALRLNCPHLVPHYRNLESAKTWRKLYLLQAQLHDVHGHHIDAQQARQTIQYLDDIINVMQIQIRTRQDGGYLPFADTLPPASDEEGGAQ